MIPSYFKIEILAIRDEFVPQGHKRLKTAVEPSATVYLQIVVYGRGQDYIQSLLNTHKPS